METTHTEFQDHYRYISHVIDFLTAFQDRRRVIEQTSKHSIVELIRILDMLQQNIDHFENFAKIILHYPDNSDGSEDPDDVEDPEGPENPETWPMVKEVKEKKQ